DHGSVLDAADVDGMRMARALLEGHVLSAWCEVVRVEQPGVHVREALLLGCTGVAPHHEDLFTQLDDGEICSSAGHFGDAPLWGERDQGVADFDGVHLRILMAL